MLRSGFFRIGVRLALVLAISSPWAVSDVAAQTFWVNADPQVGDGNTKLDHLRRRNQLLTDFVALQAMEQPDFALYDGDLVARPRAPEYAFFRDQVRGESNYLVHGNHDGAFPDTQFLDAQADVGSAYGYWYSFDHQGWHMVVLPAQSRVPEQSQRDELLNWLEEDLAANELPVMVFHHYHFFPCGLSQCEYYTVNMAFKKSLVDRFTKYGVRYVFSGHVHAGAKSTTKMSWSYRGVQYVVLPSPLEARAFGEEFPQFSLTDLTNAWAFFTEITLQPQLRMTVRQIHTQATQVLPLTYPQWPTDERVFLPNVQISAEPFVNGDLNTMDGWKSPFRYQTDVDPNYQRIQLNGAIRMRTVSKGTTWMRDEFDEFYQIVDYQPGVTARMALEQITSSGGMFMRVATYDQPFQVIVWAGSDPGRVLFMPRTWGFMDKGERFGINDQRREPHAQFELPLDTNFHTVTLNLDEIYQSLYGGPLLADKMVVSFGVWSGPIPGTSGGHARFDYVRPESAAKTAIDGIPVTVTPQRNRVYPFGWALPKIDQVFVGSFEPGD